MDGKLVGSRYNNSGYCTTFRPCLLHYCNVSQMLLAPAFSLATMHSRTFVRHCPWYGLHRQTRQRMMTRSTICNWKRAICGLSNSPCYMFVQLLACNWHQYCRQASCCHTITFSHVNSCSMRSAHSPPTLGQCGRCWPCRLSSQPFTKYFIILNVLRQTKLASSGLVSRQETIREVSAFVYFCISNFSMVMQVATTSVIILFFVFIYHIGPASRHIIAGLCTALLTLLPLEWSSLIF